MTTEISPRVRLIGGDPSPTDEFKGGAHGRIAKALVDLLITGTGGRAIGLEGSWGSGKSTVIEIASRELAAHDKSTGNKHVLFIFDAWAHQGDPILRVFLDELIVTLDAAKAVNKTIWDEKLQTLRARTKKTVETKSERLTWPAKVAVLMLPLWPLSLVLLTKYPSWKWLAIILIAIPYMAAGWAWLCWNYLRTDDGRWFVPKPGKEGRSVLWAFTKQTDQSVTNQLIREEEATTIEFNRIFDELIEDAKRHACKVVIVLDNLDRLPPTLIRDVWATMRNFFASAPGSKRHGTLQNVRLVVPFDRAHIENVFDEPSSRITSAAGEKSLVGDAPGFIEKTFEIVLRVSPPLLSNWRAYLQARLQEGLGEAVTDQQAYNIFKLFDLHKSANGSNVTPREIIAYVNAIVSQYQQWNTEIPIEYQAIYVLNRASLGRDIKPLQNSSLLDPRTAAYVSEWEWTKYVAAAHFNVSPSEALEILLATDIQKALVGGQDSTLEDLQNTQGFGEILDVVVMDNAQDWASAEPRNFITVADVINRIELKDLAVKQEVWDKLCAATAAISNPLGDNTQLEAGLVALVRNASAKYRIRVCQNLIRALSLDVTESEDLKARMAGGENFYTLVAAIAEAAKPDIPDAAFTSIFSNIRVGGSPHRVYGVANASLHSGLLSFNVFKATATADELAPPLVEAINAGELPNWFIGTIRGLLKKPAETNWTTIRDAARARLQTNNPGSPSTAGKLLEILRALPATYKCGSILNELVNDGSMQAVAEMAHKAGDFDLASRALYEVVIRKNGDLGAQDHPHYGSLQDYRTFIEGFKKDPTTSPPLFEKLSELFAAKDVGSILTLALGTGQTNEFYRVLLRDIVKKEKYTALPVEMVATNFSRIQSFLGPELSKKFATRFAAWDLEKHFPADKWASLSPKYLAIAHELNTDHAPILTRNLRSIFANVSRTRWLEILKDEEAPIDLLFEMHRLGEKLDLDTVLFDALKEHADLFLDAATAPSEAYAVSWRSLPMMLSPLWRGRFFVWLRDRLVQHSLDTDLMVRILGLYGPGFAKEGELSARRKEVVTDIVDPLLASGSDDCLTWLEESAAPLRGLLTDLGPERDIVTTRLNSLFSAEQDDARKNRIENLALSLGVEISSADSSETSEEGGAPNGSADT